MRIFEDKKPLIWIWTHSHKTCDNFQLHQRRILYLYTCPFSTVPLQYLIHTKNFKCQKSNGVLIWSYHGIHERKEKEAVSYKMFFKCKINFISFSYWWMMISFYILCFCVCVWTPKFVYDLGRSFFSLYSASSDTFATFTTYNNKWTSFCWNHDLLVHFTLMMPYLKSNTRNITDGMTFPTEASN